DELDHHLHRLRPAGGWVLDGGAGRPDHHDHLGDSDGDPARRAAPLRVPVSLRARTMTLRDRPAHRNQLAGPRSIQRSRRMLKYCESTCTSPEACAPPSTINSRDWARNEANTG